jgi:hypothetical protein
MAMGGTYSTNQENGNFVKHFIFYKLVKRELEELRRIREDNIKVLLKKRVVKAEDWMKSPHGRSSMRIFCEHDVQPVSLNVL